VKEVPYDCFDQTMTCGLSTYVRQFDLPETLNKRILLLFEGVSACYDLYINGSFAGQHKGAYSSELFDITEYIRSGSNRMLLVVDSNERPDVPPNGATVDYLIYGGIYRDVSLFLQEEVYLKDVMFRYDLEDSSPVVYPEVHFVNHGDSFTGKANVMITRDAKVHAQYEQTLLIEKGNCNILLEKKQIPDVSLWDTSTPVLYDIEITLWKEDTIVDAYTLRTGFRSLKATPHGFYVNGKKTKLIGLNRHQSYPYAGYAFGKSVQQKDAELLKDLGINTVRCSHYMQSKYFLDRCDELGLLVFEEIPGWGFIGGDEFKKVVMNDLDNMIITHFNHPSIILWGTRLNETLDNDELYTLTNSRSKALDPGRPTTGARWQTGSNLIEDIYSYNDYTPEENGVFMLQEPDAVTKSETPLPYLLSEHTGALLPAKPDDNEARHEKVAVYHAEVLNKVLANDRHLGAIAWCMSDYNTHNDHNSLQKICFHGVFDMFRVPKMSAYLYKCQKSPEEELVLEPCSMVGRGERTEPVPFYVLTNCDYIEVTLSTDSTRRYYPDQNFSNLLHPPIKVTDNGEFWQDRWQGATIVGYINDREAARRTYSNNPKLNDLILKADSCRLYNNEVDATRIVCTFVDENMNRLYYHKEAVLIETSGDIELIGPSLIPTLGGTIAFWIKTKATNRPGTATVTIKSCRQEIGEKTIDFEIS